MFQDFFSFTYTKHLLFSFTLFTSCTSTPLHTHVHNPSCHPISNTLRLRTILQPFNDNFRTPTLSTHLILTYMSWLWPGKWACVFYRVTTTYDFYVKVICFGFCKCSNWLWVFGCLKFWCEKSINVFCFRTKEK